MLEHLRQVVGQDGRTWTGPQVAQWLLEHYGITLNRTHLCEVLVRNGMSYKRTTRTLRHKQKPEQVAAKQADLETLKKGHKPD
jgi:transposase